jgi:glycosyltransferase involved in cell wall biosynthesis
MLLCGEKKINLMHTHDSHAHTLAIISTILWNNKTPLVVSRRVDFPVSNSWLSYYKYNHSSIRKIICVSEAIRKVIGKSVKNHTKLCTIYSGIDINRFKPVKENILKKEFALLPETLVVGNISALAPHKDYHTFIDIAEQVLSKNENVVFFIIGEGSEKDTLAARIKSKRLNEKIIMTGFRDDVADILPFFDIFLMTSRSEGLGTTVLDALACRVPVVATRAGGISEVIRHEKTGLLAPCGDANMLAMHVESLIANPGLRLRLTEAGYQLVKHFTKSETASQTLEIYRELVNP